MADPVMLGGLGQALIDVVDPLRRALSSPDAFEALMRRQGWKPPPTREYFAVVSDVFKLVGAVETAIASIQSLLDGDSSDPGALLAGIDALAKVIADLRAIGRPAGTLPPPFDTDEFWTTFPTDLIAALFMRYMEVAQPTWAPLHLLGVLDEEAVDPDGAPGRLAFTRSKVEWGRLVTLFSGSRIARARRLRLGRYVQARHAARSARARAARLRHTDRPLSAASVAGRSISWGHVPAGRRARTADPLVEERRPGSGFVRAGLLVLPIPPSDTPTAAPTGFFIGPYAYGQAAARVDLAGPLALELKGGLESGGNVGFEVRPQSFGAHLGTAGTDLNLRSGARHRTAGASDAARQRAVPPDPDRQEPARAVPDRPGRVAGLRAHVRVRFPVGHLRSFRQRQLLSPSCSAATPRASR